MAMPMATSWEARMLGSLRALAMAVRVPHGTLLSAPWPILSPSGRLAAAFRPSSAGVASVLSSGRFASEILLREIRGKHFRSRSHSGKAGAGHRAPPRRVAARFGVFSSSFPYAMASTSATLRSAIEYHDEWLHICLLAEQRYPLHFVTQ